tara:strand:- start:5708 stop:6580 length:873 start_codon:yes stop_codon:yes gene_type:complete
MMKVIGDAVIVAAGLGGRMLPTSAYLPKESLPLVDIPSIIHLIREAINANITRIHIITSPTKDFTTFLQNKQDYHALKPEISESLFNTDKSVQFFIHIQHEPLGLGHAILQSLESIDGPYLVLLGDNIITDQFSSITNYQPSTASIKLITEYNATGLPCAGIYSVSQSELSSYGVIALDNQLITDIIEKPPANKAPSNKVLCGRYIFTEDSKRLLEENYPVDEFGELQTIALQKHWMESCGLIGVDLSEYQWYDSGNPIAWLKSQIDYGLRNPDYSDELRQWIMRRIENS